MRDILREGRYGIVGLSNICYTDCKIPFESEYQSRLYVLNPFEALNEDGTINVDTLGEVISGVFRKYMNGDKISREVQGLIERTIRWD